MISGNVFSDNTVVSKSLNGKWSFKQVDKESWMDAIVPGTVHSDLFRNKIIKHPYYRLNEKKQQWIDKKDWEYKTEFDLSDEILDRDKIELEFEGLDTYAKVYVNKKLVLETDNMFREYRVDISDYVTSNNELLILFKSPTQEGLKLLKKQGYQLPASNDQSENGEMGDDKVSIHTRKAGYHYGWDWGPRFVTSGIWKDIRINAYSKAKILNVFYKQNSVTPELAKLSAEVELDIKHHGFYKLEVKKGNEILNIETFRMKEGVHVASMEFEINNPKLWYPNGMGKANLCELTLNVKYDVNTIQTNKSKLGLRTVELVRKKDNRGETFYFKINGNPVFAKGANYIPNDLFLTDVSPEKYEYIVKSAAQANMNMLRVWGGGIYEKEIFYDLCDKYGIMVWQDFMFACSMYPGDKEILANIKLEAIDNVKRLRSHPSVVLWCGNNEIEAAWANYEEKKGWGWKKRFDKKQRAEIWKAYQDIFHKILPDVVNKYNPQIAYWASSPSTGNPKVTPDDKNTSGDIHYWGVWHRKHPFSEFENHVGRFMSEYGFQSFPIFESVKKYTTSEDWDIESDVMASHQRSGIGNLRIKEYMDMYYKEPKDFENLLYVGQVLQGEGMKKAFEIHRQSMPYCMGTLYWQLNDCWPVASWSSIDYYGRWKATQYFAKKAFKKYLVSTRVVDDHVNIYVSSDAQNIVDTKVKYTVLDFSGNEIYSKSSMQQIAPTTSKLVKSVSTSKFPMFDESKYLLKSELFVAGKKVSEDIRYFTEVKELDLLKPKIEFKLKKKGKYTLISVSSDKLVKNLYLYSSKLNAWERFSDNFFDVIPGHKKVIRVKGDIAKKDIKFKHIQATY
jgi:beta-mannosidase